MHVQSMAALSVLIVSAIAGPASAAALAGPTSAAATPYDDHTWHVFAATARPFTSAPAPADEYFGRFKLSNLGMRNIIHDMDIEGDSPLALPLQETRIHAVAGALSDWTNRYPRDLWVPRTTASFVKFLERKQTAEASGLAIQYAVYLADKFSGTRSERWYAALLQAHNPVIDVDPAGAPPPFRLYSPFDVDVLGLRVPTIP
jgi:hypothetical protein